MPHQPTLLPDPISLSEAACLLARLSYTTLMPTHGDQVVLIDGNAEQRLHWLHCHALLCAAIDSGDLAHAPGPQGSMHVSLDALRGWLHRRHDYPPALFADAAPIPPYLDPRHPRYSPRLALAVRAWLWFETPRRQQDTQAMRSVLQQLGQALGLGNRSGQLPGKTLEACFKVINWSRRGRRSPS